ncbi:hypothetical protein [Haloferula rosea]|uniref:Uncharacterized protein n=1 Tax=Haloferula rosea TaxID=490093 RepID=A0A934VF43_9BACT|nr:hypothetical protein [Haloferula rosea]MBK1826681.1 hypothetical protein [Haloferula rosea]
MKPRVLVGGLLWALGLFLVQISTTTLFRGAEAATRYRDALAPHVHEPSGIISGTIDGESDRDIRIPWETGGSLWVAQRSMDGQLLDPNAARWLNYLGVGVFIAGLALLRKGAGDPDEKREPKPSP